MTSHWRHAADDDDCGGNGDADEEKSDLDNRQYVQNETIVQSIAWVLACDDEDADSVDDDKPSDIIN